MALRVEVALILTESAEAKEKMPASITPQQIIIVLLVTLLLVVTCSVILSRGEDENQASTPPSARSSSPRTVLTMQEVANMTPEQLEQRLRADGHSEESIRLNLSQFSQSRQDARANLQAIAVYERIDRAVKETTDEDVVCRQLDMWTRDITDSNSTGQRLGNQWLSDSTDRLLKLFDDLEEACGQ